MFGHLFQGQIYLRGKATKKSRLPHQEITNCYLITILWFDTKHVSAMPAHPMGKIGNCPGPRAQGGPALADGRKRLKKIGERKRRKEIEKRKKDRREGRKVKKKN